MQPMVALDPMSAPHATLLSKPTFGPAFQTFGKVLRPKSLGDGHLQLRGVPSTGKGSHKDSRNVIVRDAVWDMAKRLLTDGSNSPQSQAAKRQRVADSSHKAPAVVLTHGGCSGFDLEDQLVARERFMMEKQEGKKQREEQVSMRAHVFTAPKDMINHALFYSLASTGNPFVAVCALGLFHALFDLSFLQAQAKAADQSVAKTAVAHQVLTELASGKVGSWQRLTKAQLQAIASLYAPDLKIRASACKADVITSLEQHATFKAKLDIAVDCVRRALQGL